MHALKRLGGQALRQGARKGMKVLYAWDPAGIDIEAVRVSGKINTAFTSSSRPKANMGFLVEEGSRDWEREDTGQCGCDLRQAGDPL